MDSEDNSTEMPIEVVYSAHSVVSSEDPPMDEWSSLEIILLEENKKRIMYNEGLYDPGSGEVCAKCIAMSASSVLIHPYYNYPPIKDPGIVKALLAPEDSITYPEDGQALYLAICKEMNQCPVRSFYRGLLESQIDLRYYCINPNGFRAMAKALQYNKMVQVLNLTDNFFNDDACYHMGDMLLSNSTLTELNLRGCRIGCEGARILFSSLPQNNTLKVLDLSYNRLGDEGMEHLAKAVLYGLRVKNLNLSYNKISGRGLALLAESFETHNHFTHLDLSWNTICTPGTYAFLEMLSESTCLEVLNLSWNSLAGPRISIALGHILSCPNLVDLNLSNNMLKTDAINNLLGGLAIAKKLTTLNLSYNPMTPKDALNVLDKVVAITSKVRNLAMDNVFVGKGFVSLLNQAQKKKSKKNLVVTYGDVVGGFKATGPDARDIVLNRVEYITKKPTKNKADIALIVLEIQKESHLMLFKDFYSALWAAGASLDENLVGELCNVFPGPPHPNPKIKIVNIDLMVDFMKRKWPDRQLPPPPEPVAGATGSGGGEPVAPVPEPPPPQPKAKDKGKGKSK